ncbi:MAG TPA: cation transporter [Solirubrobacteraceae bacterium]|nr:cation transporter [Solirubrobacteraceae bacterium]
MSAESGELPILQVDPPIRAIRSQASLMRRARLLAWIGLGWHGIEATIAIGAGVVAGSVALVGFGADSLIELSAGLVVLWRLASARAITERRAQQMIAVSFYLLSAYVAVEAIRSLAAGDHPAVSWIGIGLSVLTLVTMPPLANAKARVAEGLESSATKSESRQTMLCAYLSAGLLLGLGLNALLGWWWADPITALGIAAVALKEGRDAWRGEACCTAPIAGVRRSSGGVAEQLNAAALKPRS